MPERSLSLLEVAILEANAVARGVPVDTLMENAGRVVAEEVHARLPPTGGRVGFLCGTGNNGGDGLSAAFHVRSWGHEIRVWLVRPALEIRTPEARRRYERLHTVQTVVEGLPSLEELRACHLLVDAMLGTGARGDLREPYRTAVERVRASGVPVLSIDLPTGFGTTQGLSARWTVALETRKEGMEDPRCGEVIVRSIGMPPEAHERTGPGEFLLFPRPRATTVKGDMGRLAIVGGGPYAGAPALAALAALRAGVDLCLVISPRPTSSTIQSFSPNLMVAPVGEEGAFSGPDAEEIWKVLEGWRPTALLIGNGAGHRPGTLEALASVARRATAKRLPLVLDADATRLLASSSAPWDPGADPRRILVTPNPRELERILPSGSSPGPAPPDRRQQVRNLASRYGLCVLAKGFEDIITDGQDLKINDTHHPAMTVGGAGDTLAGLAASLMARGLDGYQAGRLATYWIGVASIRLFPRKGYGMLATDLIEELPACLVEALGRLPQDSARVTS